MDGLRDVLAASVRPTGMPTDCFISSFYRSVPMFHIFAETNR